MNRETGFITVKQAAEKMGVIPRRVRQFINEGRLEATKVGHQWLIRREDFLVFAQKPRPVGRPPASEKEPEAS